MTAPELLTQIEARGGSVAVARDANGAAMLKITPRGLVPDLLPELAKFKPALLELLTPSSSRAATAENDVVQYVRSRSAGYFAQQRAHAEIARRWSDADCSKLSRLCALLDAGTDIE